MRIIDKFKDKINGVLTGFDRMMELVRQEAASS